MTSTETIIGTILGFIAGMLSWLLQQWVEKRQQKHNVLTLLQLENEHNRKVLENFWQQVVNSPYDFRDIEKYHRLAYNFLPAWDHLMWASQAHLLYLLDKKTTAQVYELHQNLDTFLALRRKMQEAFETDKGRDLWKAFVTWKKAYHHPDVQQRYEAQHGEKGRTLDKEINEFSSSLTECWNQANALYQRIMRSATM